MRRRECPVNGCRPTVSSPWRGEGRRRGWSIRGDRFADRKAPPRRWRSEGNASGWCGGRHCPCRKWWSARGRLPWLDCAKAAGAIARRGVLVRAHCRIWQVGKRSMSPTGWAQREPPGANCLAIRLGGTIMSGTRVERSQPVHLPQCSFSPRCQPWSLQRTIHVLAAASD